MAKKYSVNTENGKVVSVEVDGVRYDDPAQVPDPEDRAMVEQLMSGTSADDTDRDFNEQEFETEFKDFDKDFQELERQAVRFPPIIVGVFTIIAVIMLVIAAISSYTNLKNLSREQSAPGHVVDLVVRQSQVNSSESGTPAVYQDFYYPVVEFELPDGTRKTVQLAEGSWPPSYEKGEAVTVLYDPQRPLNARIQSASSTVLMWILPGITGILGLVFLGAAFFVRWFLRDDPTQVQEPGINQLTAS